MTQQATVGAVVIGASSGAVEALSLVLSALPEDCPFPVMAVVHLPPDRKSAITEVLQMKCRIRIKEAEDKEPLAAATVYFAPPDYHLLVEAGKYFSLSTEEPILFSRPSIDVLFESAADVYGSALLGIILTGANADGAKGLAAIAGAGGMTVAQRPEDAYASAMPRAAIDACPQARVLSLAEIASFLQKAASL